MSNFNTIEDQDKLRGLPWMVALAQAVGITMVVIVGVWLNKYLGGFAWDGSGREFNLHVLCMVCGIIFLYGEAILVYRIFRNSTKTRVKLTHAGLFLLAFFVTVIGLIAVFQFHNAHKIPNMYSLHSWCGLTTVLLFCLQFVVGLCSFMIPGASRYFRRFYLPIHRYFGSAILMLAGVSAIAGINEKLFFVLPAPPNSTVANPHSYSSVPPVAALGNVCGLIILIYILVVLFIVLRTDWKRENDAEDESLSVHFRTLTTGESDTE